MVAIKQKLTYLPDGTVQVDAWLLQAQNHYRLPSVELIKKTLHFAQHEKGMSTFYGQPCLEQGLEMANILLELQLDEEAICAAILTSLLNHTSLTFEKISLHLNESIIKLLKGVKQMEVINTLLPDLPKHRNQNQIDRLRKTFLAMASDIRVVLIKLAEHTVILRGIKHINPDERKKIAQQTLDIYAPLANRLGIGQLKWELEDLAFHYIHPAEYKMIAQYLAEKRIDREKRIGEIVKELESVFAATHVNAKITGRAKHIYSIFIKMKKKHLDYKAIYDTNAVRVLVDSQEECYTALSLIHRLWEPILQEFDDYIAHPKPNGYRSIHTAVLGPGHKNLEIQIRTFEMHEESEHGVAAHWLYKENKETLSGYETKITFLRQLLAWPKEFHEKDTQNLFEDRVYVFTPTGDIIDLIKGATPLDFAYHIHTELGHRCRGAKINGHIVPLIQALRTGDRIEILTHPHASPSWDWLNKEFNYIKTPRAHAKVKQWFKQQKAQQPIHSGKTVLERTQKTAPRSKKIAPPSTPKNNEFQLNGIHVATRIAKCCKPIPGDNIVGYITLGRGISIHRQECSNIPRLLSEAKDRIVNIDWNTSKQHHSFYHVDLELQAQGDQQVLKEITALLTQEKINLITLNSVFNPSENIMFMTITIQIHYHDQLTHLMNALSKLPYINEVKRSSKH